MSIILLAISILMFIAYYLNQRMISMSVLEGTRRQTKVMLPGKKSHYVLKSGASIFLGLTALYFAGVTYFTAPFQPICWFSLAFISSVLLGFGTFLSLRFATFEGSSEQTKY